MKRLLKRYSRMKPYCKTQKVYSWTFIEGETQQRRETKTGYSQFPATSSSADSCARSPQRVPDQNTGRREREDERI